MKILLGDKGHIDFENPVKMTVQQKEQFIQFLKSLFDVVQVEDAKQLRIKRLGDKFFMQEWTLEEYELLLHMQETTEEIAEKLGRTWMSVDIKRGWFISQFLAWSEEKKRDPFKDDAKDLIKEFLKDKKDKILARREVKKEIRRKEKELIEIKKEIDVWCSDKKRKEIQFLIKIGKIPSENIDEFIMRQKNKLIHKRQEIKKEIKELSE